jgi:Alpha/beta hydrolase domain
LSIEERYRDQADYVRRVARAARALVNQRLLLSEDADRMIREAEKCKIFGG